MNPIIFAMLAVPSRAILSVAILISRNSRRRAFHSELPDLAAFLARPARRPQSFLPVTVRFCRNAAERPRIPWRVRGSWRAPSPPRQCNPSTETGNRHALSKRFCRRIGWLKADRTLQHPARAHRDLRRDPELHRRRLQSLRLGSCRNHSGAWPIRPGQLYDKPRKDIWIRPLRRDWKRILNR